MKKTTQQVVAENLQRILDAKGISQSDLARGIDVHPSTVSVWLRGEGAPRADTVDKICTYLHITRADLILDTDISSGDSVQYKTIPLYNSIYSDMNPLADTNIARMLAIDESEDADLAIIVSSYSMDGMGIEPGDIALFKKDYRFTDGRVYAVWLIDLEEVILKRVYKQNDQYTLLSANPNLAPLNIDIGKAFIIGELSGIRKKWKWD